MKPTRFLLAILALSGCAGHETEVKRFSPVVGPAAIPAQCRVVSLLKDSAAQKAGIGVGDQIKSVNGQVPKDASLLAEVVAAAPDDSNFEVIKKDGSAETLKIHLDKTHPRLGTVCDLAGWEKLGVTAAGNESVTVFSGPFGMTVSGIVDKAVLFVRVRLTNNLDKPIAVGPNLFQVTDGSGASLPLLSPKEVMCFLYGDQGAHLLALKKKHKETLDAQDNIGSDSNAEDRCTESSKGHQAPSDAQYVEANAQYMATESLWPNTTPAGGVADGLIYAKESTSLSLTVTAHVEGQSLVAKLGIAVGVANQMKHSELIQFFEAQKKGNPIRLTLHKGRVFVGKFASYDPNEERVWFDTPSGGMLSSTSYSVDYIRYAEPLEQIPPKPSPTSQDLN